MSNAKSREFFKNQNVAKKLYGESDSRPQDSDPNLLRAARRVNYGIIAEFPANYEQSLRDWIEKLEHIPEYNLSDFSNDMVILQDERNQSKQVIQLLRPPPGTFAVLAVDFEFHQEYSYDGFISVGSVSSPTTTFVVDCLNANRQFAKEWMSKMLTGVRTLKVFCGCANDIFRLQKDWSCFANGVVDLQDIFSVWKTNAFEDCLEASKRAVRKRLQEQKKPCSTSDCASYLQNLDSPGLGLLMEIFFPVSDISKSSVATFADWRKRPLHQDLVKYAACDSYFTLKIFYRLYKKVGLNGIKAAAKKTVVKLLNRSSLPRYNDKSLSKVRGQWCVEQLIKWRMYLALNFDRKPEQVLPSQDIPKIATELDAIDPSDNSAIMLVLRKYRLNDDIQKGAKLLSAYLDKNGGKLEAMENVRCHNCNNKGHVAKFCFFDSMPESKKEFRDSPENAEAERRNYERRRINWCTNRKLDPKTTVCPWETKKKVLKVIMHHYHTLRI